MERLCVAYSDNTQKAWQVNLLYALFLALFSLSFYKLKTAKITGRDYWADYPTQDRVS